MAGKKIAVQCGYLVLLNAPPLTKQKIVILSTAAA